MKLFNYEIGKDKVEHFIVWAVMSFILFVLLGVYWGFFWSIVFGILKEVYDMYVKDTSIDNGDLVADCLGILFSLIIFRLIGL